MTDTAASLEILNLPDALACAVTGDDGHHTPFSTRPFLLLDTRPGLIGTAPDCVIGTAAVLRMMSAVLVQFLRLNEHLSLEDALIAKSLTKEGQFV